MTRILVTGAAGFIGFHTSQRLLDAGHDVIGLDNLNEYYDVSLKEARLARLRGSRGFLFEKIDLNDGPAMTSLFVRHRPARVIHLAAQAGVRYSLANPRAYLDSNLAGFLNVLEACRHNSIEHLVYASSSSVYGANTRMPFEVGDNVDHPLSLYAATKKANELMAHSYAHVYGLPVTGLRFFTVYGPWGRPDMALFLFTRAILSGEAIDVFNFGNMRRDFTYIDDIVDGIVRSLAATAQPNPEWNGGDPDPATSSAPYRLYNIGHGQPVELGYMIDLLERALGRQAKRNLLPMQAGDVPATSANIDRLARDAGFRPLTSIEIGIPKFVEWYRTYYSA